MSIKKLAPTASIPNPLHQFASYTYSWSLWKLHVSDFNRLMDSRGVEDAMTWNPSNRSFVLAEDGGRYPDRRQPNTLGLNYHIQDVQFETVVAPNKTSKSSNMISGSLTILEPYGVTLIESLIAASREGNQYNNYVDQPYMLQLEFRGYDDRGQEIPKSETVKYNKRFPIRILEMKVAVTTRGAEYKITFVPTGQSARQESQYRVTPIQFDITAGTVGEFFTKLEEKYAEFFKAQMIKVNTDISDAMRFKIDPTIAESKIVNEDKIPLTKVNPLVAKIDRKKSTFSIPRGTPIVDIITRVMSHSSYLIDLQLGLEKIELDTERGKSTDYIFNAFKTTSKIVYGGVDINGQPREPAINAALNRYPKLVTYNISQYSLWNVPRPEAPPFTNSVPYTIKYYNYLYTGQNTDIIDLKIDFNTTYYTAILAHTNAKAATDSSPDTDVAIQRYEGSSAISLNPAIFTKIFPALAAIPNSTPLQYRFVADDVNLKSGMNIADREAALRVADMFKSIYTAQNQEMLQLDLTIVGDPTLIKQDDWLYVVDPEGNSAYNDWSTSSSGFVSSHGHLPFDRSEQVVNVRINSPVDMDIDIYNEGVAYPQPRYSQSLFSGQYRILNISNKFSGGKFEQVLHMVRLMNSDYQTAFAQVSESGRTTVGPVGTGINNDLPLSTTNEIPAAGDEYDPDNVSNEPLPIDTSIPPGTTLILNPSSDAPWTVEVNGDPRQ